MKRSSRARLRRLAVQAVLPLILFACAVPSHVEPKRIASNAPPTEHEAIERLMGISSHFERLPFVACNDVGLLQDGPATYAAITAVTCDGIRRYHSRGVGDLSGDGCYGTQGHGHWQNRALRWPLLHLFAMQV